mgnify:CR=1 FL=1
MTRARSPDREKARLMWLRSGKTLKLKEIAEKLGWKINRVKYHVNRMRQQNIIKRVGTSHKGHWEVV